MTIFRFDDCSINTDAVKLDQLLRVIEKNTFGEVEIILAISPIVFGFHQLPEGHSERVHPTRLTAMSSLDVYYRGATCGLPHAIFGLLGRGRVAAGHGLMHVDHRLLGHRAQEMSIIGSCSLAQARIFVPPYNKWNGITESICANNGFRLIKFEEGWQHVLYTPFNVKNERLYYLHPYDTTPEKLEAWFQGGKA